MYLWIDDLRKPPSQDWIWVKSTQQAIAAIRTYERNMYDDTIVISLDHDSGAFFKDGGDYIQVLNWLEREGIVDTGYFFHLHSMNIVGKMNMRAIINHNGWREIR